MTLRESDFTTFRGWPAGKNTVAPETRVPKKSLREALNVDLDNDGIPRRRAGYTEVYSGSDIHSLWGDGSLTMFVEGTELKRLFSDNSVSVLRTGLDVGRYVSYVEVNGDIYYSNNAQTGKLSAAGLSTPWGVEDPSGQPLVAPMTTGAMGAGMYQVAVTFVSTTGEVSGSTLATIVTLQDNQGVQLSSIPQPTNPSVSHVRVFISEPNGDLLYQQVDIPIGVTSYMISRTLKSEPLDTQFLSVTPAGHIVRHYNGRNLIAADNVLVYTEALRYGLYRPVENYIQFPARITVIQPVSAGVFVVADKTYYLSGQDIKEAQLLVVDPNSGVEGTGMAVDAELFDIDGVAGSLAYWFGASGAMIGLPDGSVQPIMQDMVAVSGYNRGTTLFREVDGIRQMVTAVRGKGQGSSFGAGDSATAEVIRHGISV